MAELLRYLKSVVIAGSFAAGVSGCNIQFGARSTVELREVPTLSPGLPVPPILPTPYQAQAEIEMYPTLPPIVLQPPLVSESPPNFGIASVPSYQGVSLEYDIPPEHLGGFELPSSEGVSTSNPDLTPLHQDIGIDYGQYDPYQVPSVDVIQETENIEQSTPQKTNLDEERPVCFQPGYIQYERIPVVENQITFPLLTVRIEDISTSTFGQGFIVRTSEGPAIITLQHLLRGNQFRFILPQRYVYGSQNPTTTYETNWQFELDASQIIIDKVIGTDAIVHVPLEPSVTNTFGDSFGQFYLSHDFPTCNGIQLFASPDPYHNVWTVMFAREITETYIVLEQLDTPTSRPNQETCIYPGRSGSPLLPVIINTLGNIEVLTDQNGDVPIPGIIYGANEPNISVAFSPLETKQCGASIVAYRWINE